MIKMLDLDTFQTSVFKKKLSLLDGIVALEKLRKRRGHWKRDPVVYGLVRMPRAK